MQIKEYRKFNEKVYIDKMDNGLSVVVVPKKGYQKTYATLSVKYGSIDTNINGKNYPAGIAHFLEHKMFDKKDHDAMDVFSKYGAGSNAFTSFNKTSYLFSTTDNVYENLNELLDFVQEPYFDDAKVEKEKGIIGQEISMYDDEPGAVLFFKTVQNMFPDTPLNVDIAGTENSIYKITKQDLYDSYNYLYQPQNMQLTVVGNVIPQDIFKCVSDNQGKKAFDQPKEVKRTKIESSSIDKETNHYMDVNRPKVALGIKGDSKYNGNIKYELSISLLLQLLLSEGSEIYEKMYNDGIIDDSFGFDFDCEEQFNFAVLAGETEKVDEFIDRISDVLVNFSDYISDKADEFELIKKEEIGQHVSMMNSIEAIANNISDEDHDFENIYDEIEMIKQLELDDLIHYGKLFLNPDMIVKNKIFPKNKLV
ncbi:insulinase family protein [Apilactobacillus nanyangensis]|uniref:Insulinase family protein n=1 Tax=Apilactobacillus nanyangensis TaxID=2799579 RepID=A0ABT0HWU1_9LACO|nr:pitrilysin family protein [Apilactobacillus nanyangensis]MCK8611368.1 insulinase family protein [Apilactobacillus nanyangensis]